MYSKCFQARCSRLCFSVLLALAVLIPASGTLLADDYELPYIPTAVGGTDTAVDFGDTYVETPDIIGSRIDAKDVVEPQLTALLIMGEIDTSPSETVIVSTQPTFDVDVYAQ